MTAFFQSCGPSVTLEVGVYQDFAKHEPKDAPVETAHKPKLRLHSVVLLSFGLLCVLQGILNICLRLTLTTPTAKDGCLTTPICRHNASTDGRCETEAKRCPQDWLMFASSCYYISAQRRSWDDSRRYCLQNGADLVIINSTQEQKFLSGFTTAAWVGMTDREEEGKWLWVDGTPVNIERVQWARGQPDGAFGGEDCGELRVMCDFKFNIHFNGLNDFKCSTRIKWICEKML